MTYLFSGQHPKILMDTFHFIFYKGILQEKNIIQGLNTMVWFKFIINFVATNNSIGYERCEKYEVITLK